MKSYVIHQRAISHEIFARLVIGICCKITHLMSPTHFLRDNKLNKKYPAIKELGLTASKTSRVQYDITLHFIGLLQSALWQAAQGTRPFLEDAKANNRNYVSSHFSCQPSMHWPHLTGKHDVSTTIRTLHWWNKHRRSTRERPDDRNLWYPHKTRPPTMNGWCKLETKPKGNEEQMDFAEKVVEKYDIKFGKGKVYH